MVIVLIIDQLALSILDPLYNPTLINDMIVLFLLIDQLLTLFGDSLLKLTYKPDSISPLFYSLSLL